jgi:hypothetical protein
MRKGEASARARKLVIPALVLVAHGAVLWALAHRIPWIGAGDHPFDDSRAMEVDLELLPRPDRLAPLPQSPRRAPHASAPSAPSLAIRPSVAPARAEAAIPMPPTNQPNVDAGKDEGVRRTLGQVLGCNSPDSYGLTREQRTDCFRKARPMAPLAQPFSPHEIAAFQADEPRDSILVRHPHNGCLPRAGERAPPSRPSAGGAPIAVSGPAGAAAARSTGGVGCAWSF